jgi:hypothetical protein
MLRSISLRVGALLLLAASATAAPGQTLVGAVASVTQDSLELKAKDAAPRVVTLTKDTKYVRWITHQPWQQSTAADKSLLGSGRCISVELRENDERVAKLVRINMDSIGSIYCPCRSGN